MGPGKDGKESRREVQGQQKEGLKLLLEVKLALARGRGQAQIPTRGRDSSNWVPAPRWLRLSQQRLAPPHPPGSQGSSRPPRWRPRPKAGKPGLARSSARTAGASSWRTARRQAS